MKILTEENPGADNRLPPHQFGELVKELAKHDDYNEIKNFLS